MKKQNVRGLLKLLKCGNREWRSRHCQLSMRHPHPLRFPVCLDLQAVFLSWEPQARCWVIPFISVSHTKTGTGPNFCFCENEPRSTSEWGEESSVHRHSFCHHMFVIHFYQKLKRGQTRLFTEHPGSEPSKWLLKSFWLSCFCWRSSCESWVGHTCRSHKMTVSEVYFRSHDWNLPGFWLDSHICRDSY